MSWLLKKANGNYGDDPGVGPAGASRLFGAERDEYSSGPLDVVLGDPFADITALEPSEAAHPGGERSEVTPPDASAPATPSPALSLPPLLLGSDVDIAKCVARLLNLHRGEVLFDEGHFWFYDTTHWRPIHEHQLRRAVHNYDGAPISGSRERVRLGKNRIDSVLNEMKALLLYVIVLTWLGD